MLRILRRNCVALVLLAGVMLSAADFSVRLLGEPDGNATSGALASLFDGGKNYSDPSLLFLGAVPQAGCGALVEFSEDTALSRIVVYTAKPNDSLMAPWKTEFSVWDEDGQVWREAEAIDDVTGRAKEQSFTAASIGTEWQAPAETVRAVRIVMTGAGVWLTEIEVYDVEGRLLKPAAFVPEELTGARTYSALTWLGGVPGHPGAWGKEQHWVGNPNTLNRRDRVAIAFDMGPFIQAGSVKSAILDFAFQPIGCLTGNRFSVSMLMPGHRELTNDDLLFGKETLIEDFIFDRLSRRHVRLDVTKQVNALLAEGEAALTLRFRDETIERVGNRFSSPEGVTLMCEDARLEVVK